MQKKWIGLILVILAGETVFLLPFGLPRMYRPLMIEAWGLTNFEFGMAFTTYGITAMISYGLGGFLADQFQPKNLIALSLSLTGLVGIALIYTRGPLMLMWIYGLFGVSNILFLWGAMIKVTHYFGGDSMRAQAMGFLEGGRGLVMALVSSALLFFVSMTLIGKGDDYNALGTLNWIITLLVAFSFLVAILVYFFLKEIDYNESSSFNFKSIVESKKLLADAKIWLLGLIIFSSYCGYKSIDNYSIYLTDVLGMSALESSSWTSFIFWLRPASAIVSGYLADFWASRQGEGRISTLLLCLVLSGVGQLLLSLCQPSYFNMTIFLFFSTSILVFAIRSVYFSIFQEIEIKDVKVGTAIGFVSIIGFLPDLFYSSLTGYFIDQYPGSSGYVRVFSGTGVVLLMGALGAYFLMYKIKSSKVVTTRSF